jgi:hypothetical protein
VWTAWNCTLRQDNALISSLLFLNRSVDSETNVQIGYVEKELCHG